jgi:hypothetical protein
MIFFTETLARCDQAITRFASKVNWTALQMAAVLLPVVIALTLPPLIFGKSLFSFVPNSSDEIIYWREIKTYTDFSFSGGQYSTDEQPALVEASPFGSHGPAFTIFYGIWGKIFGWQPNSALIIQTLLVPFAILLAISLTRPDQKQLLLLTGLLTTWWPLQLYLASNMQEVLHLVIAIILAALFFQLLTTSASNLRFGYSVGALLFFGLPFRFIWAFLFFPLILILYKKITWKIFLLAVSVTAVFLLLGALFVHYFYSPYPWFSNQLLQMLASSPHQAVLEAAAHFWDSIKLLASPSQGNTIVFATRYLILFLLFAITVWLIRHRSKTGEAFHEGLFHLINLGSVLLFVLLFYDVLDTRDFRMYISPLLLSGLLFVFMKRWKFVYAVLLFNLVLLLPFILYYSQYRYPNFNHDPAVIAEVSQKINPILQFDAGGSRWCNTISVSKYGRFNPLSYPLIAIPSGFGVTTILDWKQFLDRPLQAQYIWLDPEFSVAGLGYPANRFDLVELVSTSLGSVYLNPLANCPG